MVTPFFRRKTQGGRVNQSLRLSTGWSKGTRLRLAQLVVSKYGDRLPLSRLKGIVQRG
jgi:hypothetical protein